ncbi:MAG: DUF695 domain-containing protein [Pirellulaceae bacterium]
MPWTHYQFEIHGRPVGVLLDTQFASQPQREQLPNVAWFGVFCRLPPSGAFWDPKEQEHLDAIESDLIGLCGSFGNGWAIYVRRVDTPGLREYYVYFGGIAELEKVLPGLKSLHADYRIEFESRPDPEWEQYESWIKESEINR